MRILLVDPDPARAAETRERLAAAEPADVCWRPAFDAAEAEGFDVVVLPVPVLRQLQQDLDKAQADLAARKLVERAKALVMKERGLDEAAAYGLLRKLSMDTGRSLGAVAADLLALAGVLKG